MNRILPDKQYFYKGTLGSGSALLPNSFDTQSTVKCVYIKSLILTNLTSSDVTVTLTTGETSPVTEWPLIVSANDQVARDYAEGWEFTEGIKASASSGSAIRAQIWGYQK